MQTILFLHGWGGDASSFAPISQYFARTVDADGEPYQVFTPAVACPPQTVYTLEDYADDIDNFLQVRQVTQCIVVAHSFGARLVAVLNARHPQLFSKIVITGGAGLKNWRLKTWLKIQWYRLRRRLGLKPTGGSADYRRLDDNGKRTFQNIVNRDLSREIAQITAPVLLIWGAQDRETPLCHMHRFARLIPHAKKIVYLHSDHFAYLSEAGRFINDVSKFLMGVKSAK